MTNKSTLLKLLFSFLLFIGYTIIPVMAKDIYVSSQGDDAGEGTQSNPYRTFGKALSVVESNDMIYIQDMISMQKEVTGERVGQVPAGNQGIVFPAGKTNITVCGVSRTGSGFEGSKTKGLRFLFLNGTNGFTFKNLTFRYGLYYNDAACPDGGSVYVKDCVATFESCDFLENGYTKALYGGAIRVDNSTVSVTDCRFIKGQSPRGAGIYVDGGKLLVNNSVFEEGNSTNGGAISSNVTGSNTLNPGEKEVEIHCKNSRFTNNKGTTSGGAIYIANTVDNKAANLYLEGCTFVKNTGRGGALYLENKKTGGNSYLTVNSTFYKNHSPTDGGAMFVGSGQVEDSFSLVNCTVIENTSNGANAGFGGGIRFYREDNNSNSSQVMDKKILNCIIENNYATNGGKGNLASDLSFRYTPEAANMTISNSFIGTDGNSNIPLETYIDNNFINYYATVESLAEISEETSDIFERDGFIAVSPKTIASNYGDASFLLALNITSDQKGNTRPFTGNRCSIGAIEVVPNIEGGNGGEVSGEPTFSSYKGLIMAGYQGWFGIPGDEVGNTGHAHLAQDSKFEAGHANIEFWPDMREYEKQYEVNFVHKDGSQAYFFSSSDESTVDLHFKWMKEHNIDGVFIQRFTSSFTKRSIGRVLKHAVNAAKKYNRAFCIMYDLSGGSGDWAKTVNDWRIINTKYRFTDPSVNPTYLHHNGKPLLALWGIGINNNVAGFEAIMDRLAGLDGQTGKLSYMLGSAYYWRNGGGDVSSAVNLSELKRVLKKGDIISPWAVGRYQNTSEYLGKVTSVLQPDITWCKNNNIDYAPVVLPGFSWRNLKQLGVERYDQIPRDRGNFLWTQIAKSKQSGAEMIYVAMFDELDEGTCIFKCANTKDVPVFATPEDPEGKFLGIDDDLPTDYYLFLAGEGGKWLKGATGYGDQKPNYVSSTSVQEANIFPVELTKQGSLLSVKALDCGDLWVKVYNSTGKLMFVLNNQDKTIPFNQTVDLKNLASGIYIVHLTFEGENQSLKIVCNH